MSLFAKIMVVVNFILAVAFLAAMVVQYALYTRASTFTHKKDWLGCLLVSILITVCSGLAAINLTDSLVLRLLVASALYCLLGRVTGLLRAKEMIRLAYKPY